MKNTGLKCELDEISKLTEVCFESIKGQGDSGPNVHFLENGNILALPRKRGDSRYVYGDSGFNYWVHASGYMYSNEGLFSLFMRRKEGDEPVIGFFVGLPGESGNPAYQPVSLLPVPVIENSEDLIDRRYTVMNKTAAYFFTEIQSLLGVVRVTVDDCHRIVYTVHIENKGDTAVRLYTSSFFKPFCRYDIYESDEDRWFLETALDNRVDSDGNFSAGILEVAQDEDRFTSLTHYGVLRGKSTTAGGSVLTDRQTNTSRRNFVGDSRRNLTSALSLREGRFTEDRHITTFTDVAVLSDLNFYTLQPGSNLRLDYVFEIVHDEEKQKSIRSTHVSPREIDDNVAAGRLQMEGTLSALRASVAGMDSSLDIDEFKFNEFFNHLKYQVSICGLLKGYMQLELRSLIGVRDVFQALEGLLYYRPRASREKMLEALGFTITTGRCIRQYSLPPRGALAGRADCREFIDQGLWVITAIHSYLQYTGDKEFLDTIVGYHEITDEASESILPTAAQDSVLEHLFRIMDYLDRNRDHDATKLTLALYGDWNDALDGLGITNDPNKSFGTGVSVMATLQFYQNCAEMINILKAFYPGKYDDKIEKFGGIRKEIGENLLKYAVYDGVDGSKRIYHGWGDQRQYFVGGPNDPDGASRDGVTGYAFWVLSDMLKQSPDMEDDILRAFDRLQSKYGLLTFNPAFPKNTPGVGRIPKLPPGTAENGATYIHATLFGIMAYFKMGQAQEAWKQIEKILPFTTLHDRYSHSPFVMPNSYVFNSEKGMDGESMNDWQTGSSNVLLKILLWYVYGYKPDFEGLRIQVAAWVPFDKFEFVTELRGSNVKMTYQKNGKTSGRRIVKINGIIRSDGTQCPQMKTVCYFLPYADLQSDNLIEICDS